jgi:hypothetical protein
MKKDSLGRTVAHKLVRLEQVSAETGISVRTLQTMMQTRKIPFLRFGHRTCFFEMDRVRAALARFEVSEVGARQLTR